MATYLKRKKALVKRREKFYKKKLFHYRFCIILKLLVVVSVFFAILAFLKDLFSLKEVIVDSDIPFYKTEDFFCAGNIQKGQNIFFCNEKNIKEDIEKKLPFAEITYIKKKLPNKILIKVKKISGFAAFKSEEGHVITDEALKVLEIIPEVESSLISVDGVNLKNYSPGEILSLKNEQQKNVLFDILRYLNKNSLNSITSIDLGDLENIKMVYENRILVKFGDKKDLEDKVKTMAHILKEKIKNDESGELDLSSYRDNGKVYFLPNEQKKERDS